MYTFTPITNSEEQIALLLGWFQRPHVAERWDGAPQSAEEVQKKFSEKIENPKVFPYIISLEEKPMGFIQMYEAFEAGDGWWEDEPEGTWGMDLFIGEEELLNQGHGTAIVRAFMQKIIAEKHPKKIIIDPKPDNARAIRVYEKAGFQKVGEVTTPDGPALLMNFFPEI